MPWKNRFYFSIRFNEIRAISFTIQVNVATRSRSFRKRISNNKNRKSRRNWTEKADRCLSVRFLFATVRVCEINWSRRAARVLRWDKHDADCNRKPRIVATRVQRAICSFMISRIVGGSRIIERTCDINYARVRVAREERTSSGA